MRGDDGRQERQQQHQGGEQYPQGEPWSLIDASERRHSGVHGLTSRDLPHPMARSDLAEGGCPTVGQTRPGSRPGLTLVRVRDGDRLEQVAGVRVKRAAK